MNQQQKAFIDEVLPLARQAAAQLHIPTSAVLAQWIDETGAGTSDLFVQHNNFAGVYGDADGQTHRVGATVLPSGFLGYPTREAGMQGYVERWQDPIYGNTRNAWHADDRPIMVAKAMQASPWAAGHYNYRDLETLIEDLDLVQFDSGGGTGPVPGPPPESPCSTLPLGPAPQGHTTLRIGAHGPEVAQLQDDLRHAGIVAVNSFNAHGQPDGIFGPGTAAAVVEFQNRHGLHADGIVGRQTWCALGVR